MATVFVSQVLRPFVPGRSVEVPGRTVGQVVEALGARYPGVMAVLLEDGDLRPGVAVSVGDQLAQDGLLEPVGPGDEVHFLPAFAGG